MISKKNQNTLTIKLPKGKSNVAGNVNSVLKDIADPIKSIKSVKIK